MCSDHRGRAPPLYSPLPSFYSQLVPLPHVCHKSPSQNTPCGGLKRWSSPHGATHPPPATLPASHPPRHLLYRLICAPQSYRDLIYSTQLSLKMLLFDRVAGEVWGGGSAAGANLAKTKWFSGSPNSFTMDSRVKRDRAWNMHCCHQRIIARMCWTTRGKHNIRKALLSKT